MSGLQIDDNVVPAYAHADLNEKKVYEDDSKGSSINHELDGIHDGLVFPTEEEKATLRRVPDAIPWNAYLIALVELAERFSYYGSTVVFQNFIQRPLPPGSRTGAAGLNGQAGALGMGQRTATAITTFFQFWTYITPILGAYIADSFLGRYKTICYAILVALVGHVILIISAIPGVVEKSGAFGAYMVAIIIMGLGTGLFKSNISPLIAEQYKRTKLFVEVRNGERVIVDPSLTVSRVYMYFYLFINIGALVGQISMSYSEKFVGFYLAYTLPTFVFLLCPIVMWVGRNRYIRSPPQGSVVAKSFHVFRYAARGKWSINPIRTFKNMSASGFWDAAKPSNVVGPRPSWMTYDDKWVDEVARGFAACGVFCWYPLYWLTYNQLNNNLTSQAGTMNTHGLPNDVLSNLDPLALVILIPLCDIFFYPWLRRAGINFSALKKITLGFWTGAAAMVWAAVVQHYIYKTHPCGDRPNECPEQTSPLNVWIQSGAYILVAISEILASITGLEYAFTKAPRNMRSLVMAVYLFTSAISAALGEAFVSLSDDPLLVWNYGSMGVIALISGLIFWFQYRNLDGREDELNNLDAGKMDTSKE